MKFVKYSRDKVTGRKQSKLVPGERGFELIAKINITPIICYRYVMVFPSLINCTNSVLMLHFLKKTN